MRTWEPLAYEQSAVALLLRRPAWAERALFEKDYCLACDWVHGTQGRAPFIKRFSECDFCRGVRNTREVRTSWLTPGADGWPQLWFLRPCWCHPRWYALAGLSARQKSHMRHQLQSLLWAVKQTGSCCGSGRNQAPLLALKWLQLHADGVRVQLGAGQVVRLCVPHDDGDARCALHDSQTCTLTSSCLGLAAAAGWCMIRTQCASRAVANNHA